MARSAATAIQNNFRKGLITEATGLNFPEDACTETWNCVFENKGEVRRRLGIDVELEAIVQSYTTNTGAITEYLWRAVARSGVYTFLVIQIGQNVVFYELTQGSSISLGIKNFAIDLANYRAPGATRINEYHAQFSSGNGRLFVVHPGCDPVAVTYDEDTDSLEQERLHLKIRDFAGLDDDLDIDEQPSSLTPKHLYNLMNQGWNMNVRMVTPGGGAGDNAGGDGANTPFDPDSLV